MASASTSSHLLLMAIAPITDAGRCHQTTQGADRDEQNHKQRHPELGLAGSVHQADHERQGYEPKRAAELDRGGDLGRSIAVEGGGRDHRAGVMYRKRDPGAERILTEFEPVPDRRER